MMQPASPLKPRRSATKKPAVHSIVSLPDSTGYGVIMEIFPYGHRTLAAVHYIDHQTGELRECPDRVRCRHGRTCPIHGRSVDLDKLVPWPARDVVFYVSEGMISPRIAQLAGYELPQDPSSSPAP